MYYILCSVFFGFIICYYFLKKKNNFPPGPFRWPIVNNLFEINKFAHIKISEMSKKYGPIVGMYLGSEPVICVHGAELIKEAYNEIKFAGRIDREAHVFLFGDQNGIANANGDVWMEQRRFALRNLRDFGFGKSSMEEMIMEEVKEVSDWLRKNKGKPLPLQRRFALAVVNSLWRILTGNRIDHDDPKLNEIIDGLEHTAEFLFSFDSIKPMIVLFFPKIAKLFPEWSGWNHLSSIRSKREQLFIDIINNHKKNLTDENPRDFVDLYLQEIRRTTNPKSSFYGENGERSLKSVMSEMFLAGTDTTSVTLSWAMLYLLHYPHVQKKLQDEIDRVVGRNRNVSLSDKKSLPYTEAVILETFRMSSIAPVSLPHSSTADFKFHGYDIPKGTSILANLYQLHMDEKIWGDPLIFRPERFLSPDDSSIVKREGVLIPFSIGKRVCVGETLARDTIFLFVSNIAQNFEVTVPEGTEKPPLEPPRQQLTIAPMSCTLLLNER